MKRLFSIIAAALFVASLGTGAFAADTMMNSKMSSKDSMMMKCPTGQKMVKGYKKADGTMIKSYCRKSSMKSSSTKM